MPDRYANGDPSNDRGGKTGARSVTGFDPTDTGWFHGGDLQGADRRLHRPGARPARIKDLGFTAIWVTPVVGQQTVQGDSAAYHGYWGIGLHRRRPAPRERPRTSTPSSTAPTSSGMKVYLDVVVNHTADVILVGARLRRPRRAPVPRLHGKPFDAARYAGASTFPCLSAREHAAPADR